MIGLINTIISLVNFNDKKSIKELIDSELQNYVPPIHNKAILKMHWDLNQPIMKMQKIKIKYIRRDNETVERVISPLAVVFSDYYFYLIAYIDKKDYDYPAFFRLDRIVSFIILNQTYSKQLFSKYNVGNMKKNTKFMSGGRFIKVKLKVDKLVLNTILDQIPNAIIINENNSFAFLEVKIFEDGFIKWVLNNSDAVEVINPIEIRDKIKNEAIKILNKYSEGIDNNFG